MRGFIELQRLRKAEMTFSIEETRKVFLGAVSMDAQGATTKAIAELKQLVPNAHPDLVEIVLLEAMRISTRIGDLGRAVAYAKKIASIDSDPPPSVKKIIATAASASALSGPFEPDHVSEHPGEHVELEDGSAPNHFYIGKRRFDVEYREEANGVWYALCEVFRAKWSFI
jgi:hypothetical protein